MTNQKENFMSNKVMRILFLFSAICALTICANAQGPIASAHIPFSFIAGGRTLPAGDYVFDSGQSGVLFIHGGANAAVMVLTTTQGSDSGTSEPRVVFDRRGGQQFLTGIRVPSNPSLAVSFKQ
jgi:hypothetical protein